MKFGLRPFLLMAAGLFACRGAAAPSSPPSLYDLGRTWTTDHGLPFQFEALRGHPTFLAMFFTRCGSVCPATVAQLKRIEAALPPETWTKVRFVLVSFDSEGDTPAVLSAYREAMGLKGEHWILLHGDAESVRELSATLGIAYSQRAPGQFIHSGLVTLLDSTGVASQQWPSLEGVLQSAAQSAGKVR